MRHIKKILFLLSGLLIFFSNVKADHYAGAEMTYECIRTSGGTSEYIISDCL